MRTLVIVTCITVLGVVPAFGQIPGGGGHIGLYSDSPGYSDCFLAEAVYATNSIYVVHTLIAEARTAQFRVVHNWHAAIVGEVDYAGNLHLGDIYTGVTITYVGCKALPHLLAVLTFTPVAPTPPCTAFFYVVPYPFAPEGEIDVIDCASQLRHATGGVVKVNGNDRDCPCG